MTQPSVHQAFISTSGWENW